MATTTWMFTFHGIPSEQRDNKRLQECYFIIPYNNKNQSRGILRFFLIPFTFPELNCLLFYLNYCYIPSSRLTLYTGLSQMSFLCRKRVKCVSVIQYFPYVFYGIKCRYWNNITRQTCFQLFARIAMEWNNSFRTMVISKKGAQFCCILFKPVTKDKCSRYTYVENHIHLSQVILLYSENLEMILPQNLVS